MKRPLTQRKQPRFDRTMHMGLVKLNDNLNKLVNDSNDLTLNDLCKLCELIKSIATLQKYLPKPYQSARKSKKELLPIDSTPAEVQVLD